MNGEEEPAGRQRGTSRSDDNERSERPWTDRPARYPEYDELWPTPEEADEWAERERRRREAWLAGPTEQEKEDWRRRQRRARRSPYARPVGIRDADDVDRLASRYERDTGLAVQGAAIALWRWPFWLLASLTRAGQEWDYEPELGPRRSRYAYIDDDF